MSITLQEQLRDDLEIKTALISVFDKTNLLDFAKILVEFNVRLIATGGTFTAIKNAGIPVIPVTDVAPFPEMLDGRVKTLQPQIFAGILANKANPKHLEQLAQHNLTTIDMVVCNFYPFEEVAAKEGVTSAELIENIDIGGPSLVRAAAKNYASVCVVPSAAYYPALISAMKQNGGKVSYSHRMELSKAAFREVAWYDAQINGTLSKRLGNDSSTSPKRSTNRL